jgi:hypothetical protein
MAMAWLNTIKEKPKRPHPPPPPPNSKNLPPSSFIKGNI